MLEKNLQYAILCYYLNSRYARFNEYLSFSQDYNGELINIEKIKDKIENEILTNKEIYNLIESYFKAQNFDIFKTLNQRIIMQVSNIQ